MSSSPPPPPSPLPSPAGAPAPASPSAAPTPSRETARETDGGAPPSGLRLEAHDFAAPAATGTSYLFERLLGWGAAVGVRLRAGGARLELGLPPPSAEQRELFFVRSRVRPAHGAPGPAPGSRTDIHKVRPAAVAYLRLLLTRDSVEVALVVPAKARAEREQMAWLLSTSPALVKSALEALPSPFLLGIERSVAAPTKRRRARAPGAEALESGASGRVPVQSVTATELGEALRAGRAGDSLWIGWTVPRAVALAHAPSLGGELEAAMLALGSLFREIAWPPRPQANKIDGRAHASADGRDSTTDPVARPRRPPLPGRTVRDPASAAPSTVDDRLAMLRGARAAAGPGARSSLRLRSSAAARPMKASRPTPAGSAHVPAAGFRGAKSSSRDGAGVSASRASHPAEAGGIFERGAEVTVLAGPFAGRVGVVQEVDGRGGARVLFGLLATRIAAADLEAVRVDGNGRPARPSLGSSHRKGR